MMADAPWGNLITVLGVWIVAVVLPGPNFLAVVQASVSGSRRSGVWVAFGCNVGMAVWAVGSLMGLGLLFREAAWLYQIIKVLGAAYLVYVGVRLILSARRSAVAVAGGLPAAAAAGAYSFRTGLFTCLGNPKTAAFFTSLFAVAVPTTAPLWFDALLIVLMLVVQASWYMSLAWTVASGPVAAFYQRIRRGLSAVCGTIFVGLGVRLAIE